MGLSPMSPWWTQAGAGPQGTRPLWLAALVGRLPWEQQRCGLSTGESEQLSHFSKAVEK